MALLGWQGAGGFSAAAIVGAYFGFGGLFLTLGGIGEWILGRSLASPDVQHTQADFLLQATRTRRPSSVSLEASGLLSVQLWYLAAVPTAPIQPLGM